MMYVIIGATGNTGAPIVETLLNSGKRVRAIGRHLDRLRPLADKGADPFVAEVENRAALIQAFEGAKGVFLMTPPNPTSKDYRSDQDRMVAAMTHALTVAKVPYAVTLSSIGADKPNGTGPVAGLYHLEQSLNRIPGLNVLHLRAGYFMENLLAQVHVIAAMTSTAGLFHPDLRIPMIATRDISAAAGEALLRLDFEGSNTRELLGQRDLSMNEATELIGRAIGRPDLTYSPAPEDEFKVALTHLGMSPNVADLITEMCAAMNSGHMRALEPRSPANTTSTPFETFLLEEWIPAWKAAIRAEEAAKAE
ncbi:MAG TPA: NmrA family NAD(P)-binding protein [Bryobacteraceae bacterium]|nr:NmrA family NAD(P)-binding protein [Bryobacteraceae bacterium]